MGEVEGAGTGGPKSVIARERKRVEYLFAFAQILRMTPRDVDALTVGEFDLFCDQIDAYLSEQKRAAQKMERV